MESFAGFRCRFLVHGFNLLKFEMPPLFWTGSIDNILCYFSQKISEKQWQKPEPEHRTAHHSKRK